MKRLSCCRCRYCCLFISFYEANALWHFTRQEEPVCRTISLCTGMQSSTLAGLLATQFLGTSHAVPAACSVVAMAIMGLSLASFWGKGSRIRDIPLLLSSQAYTDANSWQRNAFVLQLYPNLKLDTKMIGRTCGNDIERYYRFYFTDLLSCIWKVI